MRSCPSAVVLFLAGMGLAIAVWPVGAAVTLQFNYSLDSSGFFVSGSNARASLEAVGDFFEELFLDDLAAILPGPNQSWTARVTNPGTGLEYAQKDLYVPADTLIVYVGARDLGTSMLSQARLGSYSVGGSAEWIATVETRGEGSTTGSRATDFGPWGGSVAVDADANWNTDFRISPTLDQNDLYSVLLHGVAHVLGFGTSPSWANQVNDFQFTGEASESQYGGLPVPLSDSEHWAGGIASRVFPYGGSQEAAMAAGLSQGTRKRFTRLDVAGLEDVGWRIAYPTYLAEGDLDGDGLVGGGDLDMVRLHWGQSVTPGSLLQGDPSGDGYVGSADLEIVRSHWGQHTGAPATVPEPSLLVALAGILAGALVRWGTIWARRAGSRG